MRNRTERIRRPILSFSWSFRSQEHAAARGGWVAWPAVSWSFLGSVLAAWLAVASAYAVEPPCPVIPKPSKVQAGDGSFELQAQTTVVVASPELDFAGRYLVERLKPATGFSLPVKRNDAASAGRIMLKLDASQAGFGDEGYRLVCSPQEITITALRPTGVFYGVQTLRQLLPVEIECPRKVEGVAWRVTCVTIEDRPRFAWRGLLLDPARHFLPKEFLLEYIDVMALHKLNRLHLHLTDHQGWRLEIKRYPQLTAIGSRLPNFSKKTGEGWFYSQQDMREIIAYAAARGITVVPEIEMPGHIGALQHAFSETHCTPTFHGEVCIGNEKTFEILEGVLAEVADLFPSRYIHIGGDECQKKGWKKCSRCQARIQQEGLHGEAGLQSYFVRRIEKILNAKGKTLVGWDEILEGGLAPNAVVQSWRGIQGGIQAAKARHPVIMSPTTHCYFDYYQGPPKSEPKAIGGNLPLEKVYSYEPIPSELSPDEATCILGVQGCLWGEYVPCGEHAEYMSYPRGAALAEVAWSDRAGRDFHEFLPRLASLCKRMDLLGVRYRKLDDNLSTPKEKKTSAAGENSNLAVTSARAGDIESFEAAAPPQNWKASSGGELSVTGERFKSGQQSLRWTWSKSGETLECAMPKVRSKITDKSNLALWIHNETPAQDVLRVEFLKEGQVVGKCWYGLAFRGWRPLGAPYVQVLKNPEQAFDGFRLIAPENAKTKRLHLDYVNFNCLDTLVSDDQQPWVCRPEVLNAADPRQYVYSNQDIGLNRPWLPQWRKPTTQEMQQMDTIAKRLPLPKMSSAPQPGRVLRTECVYKLVPPVSAVTLGNVLARVEQCLHLRRSGDRVTGRPITGYDTGGHCRWGGSCGFNDPADGVHFGSAMLPAKFEAQPRGSEIVPDVDEETCDTLMYQLAYAYLYAKEKKQNVEAERVLQTYFDLCDHLIDQGWVDGNNNVANGWGTFDSSIGVFQDDLARTGRLDDMLVTAVTHGTWMFDNTTREHLVGPGESAGKAWLNTDVLYFTHGYQRALSLFAAIATPEKRLQRMRTWKRIMDLRCEPRYTEFLALDGTAHHHTYFIVHYGFGGVLGMLWAMESTQGTCFTLSPQSVEMLKRATRTHAYLLNNLFYRRNVSGYAGEPLCGVGVARGTDMIARFAAPQDQPYDREMASLVLAMTPQGQGSLDFDPANGWSPKELMETAAKYRRDGVTPYVYPGHLTLNAGGMAAHRRDDWLVVVTGMATDRRGKEVNAGYLGAVNARNAKHGAISIASTKRPPSRFDHRRKICNSVAIQQETSGSCIQGWDGRLEPGATSLLNKPTWWCEGAPFLHNTSVAGGTDLDGNGVWGMDCQPNDHSLSFRKSAFFFDNRITMVTTDIRHGDGTKPDESSCPLVTTLYQNAFKPTKALSPEGFAVAISFEHVPPAEEPCWVDGREIKAFPYKESLGGDKPHWLIDNRATGFYTHSGNSPLHVERRTQTWTYFVKMFAKTPEDRDSKGAFNTSGSKNPDDYVPTQGDYAVAWFDHGVKPDIDTCVYTFIPEAAPDTMRQFAASMASPDTAPYSILQQDSAAHVLLDRASNTTAYSFFKAGEVKAKGMLAGVNRSCWVMIRNEGGRTQLSVASTDLKRNAGWHYPITEGNVVLTLRGRWSVVGAVANEASRKDIAATVQGEVTTLTIPFKDYLPVRMVLEPMTARPTAQAARVAAPPVVLLQPVCGN